MSDSGRLTFVQYLVPALESGRFGVDVTQRVAVGGQGDTFHTQRGFFVRGRRYGLGQGDVRSVFPPDGNQGDFSTVLPHVVLDSPTLPWQRSPGGPAPAGSAKNTWLALLVFDETDPPPAPRDVTLADLRTVDLTFCPTRVAEPGEDESDPVTVVDVPATVFCAIAPSLDDLAWLAHVRAVDATAKVAAEGAVDVPDYAVVFGNRLPVPGHVTTVHLVSLEGYGPYLPAADGSRSASLPAGAQNVRVVTLSSWTFSALDLKQDFAGTVCALDMTPPVLRLPVHPPDPGKDAVTAVTDAFGLGYTALDHDLRDGGTTVSWYRGPLLPLGTPVSIEPPYADADQLLRYDPDNGMFDVSYAAAWEVGRLLALHDASFAAALFRWKLTQTKASAAALEQEVIDQELPPLAAAVEGAGEDATTLRVRQVLTGLVAPAVAALTQPEGE